MKDSRFTQWDQKVQTILDAGKTEKGQYLIPLTYQFNMTCFLKEDVAHTPSASISWEDMANSSDPIDHAGKLLGRPRKHEGGHRGLHRP